MNRVPLKSIVAGLAASVALASAAQAGGFSRGNADTDVLYMEDAVNLRFGATIVAPQRGYDTLTNGPLGLAVAAPYAAAPGTTFTGADGKYSDSYIVPSAAVKFNVFDDARCAGTLTQSFGAGATYGPQAIAVGQSADGSGTVSEGFTSTELGLTCGYKFDVGPGRAWVLGGLFLENFDYSQTVRFINSAPIPAAVRGTDATLAFPGKYNLGWRAGVAYEVTSIALRGQLLYRSGVEHNPTGTFATAAGTFPTVGVGNLPQSVELKLQSGIAPGWLAFGSVKWTDWSVLQTLNYTILTAPAPLGGAKQLDYFYRDGWTVTGGVGHSFNERVSGSLSLTWDRGVSTTEDASFDTWAIATGAAVKDVLGGELRLGGALIFLDGGSVAAETAAGLPGGSFAYTVGSDITYAFSASYSLKF